MMKVLPARDNADAMLGLLLRGRESTKVCSKGWGDEPNVWLPGAERHVTSFGVTLAALQAVTRIDKIDIK